MPFLNILLFCLFLFTAGQACAASSYADYTIQFTNRSIKLDDLRLTDGELRWLSSKKDFYIAVDSSMHSVLLQTAPDQQAKGINVDYLGLLQQNLKVNIILRVYPGAEAAAAALKNGEVDAILTDLLNSPPSSASFNVSRPLLTTGPVLVTTVNNTMSPMSTDEPVKIARVKDYPTAATIFRSFPNATIVDYADHYEALASVSSGENQYFIGSNIVTSTLISRYFVHSLNAIKYYNCPCQHNFFLTRPKMAVLSDIFNHFVESLNNEARKDVIQNWLNTGNLGFITQPLDLNTQEKKWLKNHPTVKVLVTSFDPPFSMTDEQGMPRGMMGDLLNIIELQTGMKFIPVSTPITTPGDTLQPDGKWDIFPGAIHSEKRELQVAFTHTLMMSPYVFVMKKKQARAHRIEPGMKIGLPSYYALDAQLKARHPGVTWVPMTNASEAFHQIQEGELDALVATQPTARYMVDHYYPDTQVFFRIPDLPRAPIAFALPRAEPELKSILDKALDNLPPGEVLRLTEKWTKMPKVTIDTWDLYSQQFYLVTALALALVISSLLWGFYLLREVNRRKAIQGDLENQISFRKALSDSLPAPSYVIDAKGRIVGHNSAFAQYFTREHYATASLPLTHPDSPFSSIMAAVKDMQPGGFCSRPVHTCELQIGNGQATRDIQHWLTPCDRPASADRVFICGWEDITETRSLIHALEIEKNKAINATVVKSQFLATMSHEIRTPVSSIMGFLELLSCPSQTEEQKTEAIQLAYSTGQSLLGLIGEVLDVDKIESGKYQLQPEWVDMEQHITAISCAFRVLAAKKNILFFAENSLAHHSLLMIDPQAIKQVLTNLLNNALKFTDAGSITLRTKLVAQAPNIGRLVMEIVDSGSGISEEEQNLLFKPYSQTHCGRQQTGSGLGLMICKQLVEKMQGEINVVSHPGIGSTFSVVIPVSMMSRQCVAKEQHREATTLPESLRILVADDHPTNRLLLKRQLSTLGYAVTEACDGKDALDKASRQPFDLLITDVNMPHLDGIALTQALRAQNIPLTIWGLTANAQTHERDRGLSAGMDLCLFKPLSLDILKKHLSERVAAAPATESYQYLDIPALQDNTGSDPQLIREIVTTFLEATREDIEKARQTLRDQDWRTFKKHIHRIHGSAGILNLVHLREVCSQLESLPAEPELQAITPLMAELEALFCALEREISHYLTCAPD